MFLLHPHDVAADGVVEPSQLCRTQLHWQHPLQVCHSNTGRLCTSVKYFGAWTVAFTFSCIHQDVFVGAHRVTHQLGAVHEDTLSLDAELLCSDVVVRGPQRP
jgi:hypothetical protein